MIAQLDNAQLINQSSGDTEIYSPPFVIEAAREVMGAIDLDPASSAHANERVRARFFYCKLDNGLVQPWSGNVWLNHPFSREGNPLWINKLVAEYDSGRVTQACCITFASTSEAWFQPLLRRFQCFLHPRTNYYLPDGSIYRGVTKGSAVTYFGHNPGRFREVFRQFGVVK